MEKTVPNSISTRCRRKYLVIAGLVLLVIIQLYFLYLPYIRVMSVGTITATTNNNNNKDVDDIKAIVVESSIKSERILPDIYHCYHKNGSNSHLRYIEDLLTASIQPALDKTIYFVISTCFKDDLIAIRKRQACAIEAAAHHNPDRDVFVLFASPVGFAINQSDAFERTKSISVDIKLLSTIPNVHLRNVNISTLALNTPMLELEQSGRVYRSPNVAIHLADVVRLLVLYKFGGVYLDTDMIARRSFADLPPVFLAAEPDELSNAAMGSTHDGFGHAFFHTIISRGAEVYDPDVWAIIGSKLLVEVAQNECKMVKSSDDNSLCPSLKIFQPSAFNPFLWYEEDRLWNRTHTDQELLRRMNDSYVGHLWTSRSSVRQLNVDDKSVVNVLAKSNCPMIYSSSYKFNYRR